MPSNQVTGSDPVFVGLSFGGMVAIEVVKLIKLKQPILVASAKARRETPFYYKLAGTSKMHTLLPLALLKKAFHANELIFRSFKRGIHTAVSGHLAGYS